MRNLLAILVLCLLGGCAGPSGGSTPPPVPYVPPGQTSPGLPPRPSRKVFSGDWSNQNIGLNIGVTEQVPPVFYGASSIYATFAGPQGDEAVKPAPNGCYEVQNNKLVMKLFLRPGYPIVTRQTFSKDTPISIQAQLTATNTQNDCWGGLCLYNGENNYRAVYFGRDNHNKLVLGMWSTSHRVDFPGQVNEGTTYTVRIDYDQGHWNYYVDGTLMLHEGPDNVIGDPVLLLNDPAASLWAGPLELTVGSFDVCVD